jgi:glycosyltransferase involved in cell wall biosynthesis
VRFGFVGRLVSTKGIETIAALSHDQAFSNVEWNIHGAGQDYPPAWFRQFPILRYHGEYSGAGEYSMILQELDALVLLSHHNEGMPLSLIEGMSAGLPWVATDRGGTRELATSITNCTLVSPGFDLTEAKFRVDEMRNRILSGRTSRTVQRRAYDDIFSPMVAGRRWMEFLEASSHR